MQSKSCAECCFWHPENGSAWGRCSIVELPSTYVKIVGPEVDLTSLKTHAHFYCSLFQRYDLGTVSRLPLELAKLIRKR